MPGRNRGKSPRTGYAQNVHKKTHQDVLDEPSSFRDGKSRLKSMSCFRLKFLLMLVAICVGCERNAPPPQETAESDEVSETLREIAKDEKIQSLIEYGDKYRERLLTKTGEGVKVIDWDLSKDNKISLVGWPADEDSAQYILNQDIDLSIRFPAGFSVKERATLLICDRDDATQDRLEFDLVPLAELHDGRGFSDRQGLHHALEATEALYDRRCAARVG